MFRSNLNSQVFKLTKSFYKSTPCPCHAMAPGKRHDYRLAERVKKTYANEIINGGCASATDVGCTHIVVVLVCYCIHFLTVGYVSLS